MRTSKASDAASSAPDPGPLPLAVDAKRLGAMLGLSVRTIRLMDAAGKLPRGLTFGQRVKRWNVRELQDWLDAGGPPRREWEKLRESQQCQP